MRGQDPAKYAEEILGLGKLKDGYTAERIKRMFGTTEDRYRSRDADPGPSHLPDRVCGRRRQVAVPPRRSTASMRPHHCGGQGRTRDGRFEGGAGEGNVRERLRTAVGPVIRRRVRRAGPAGCRPGGVRPGGAPAPPAGKRFAGRAGCETVRGWTTTEPSTAETGTSAAGARRLPGLRVPRFAETRLPQPRRPLRPCPASATSRAARRPPAVPHRHRHDLAGPPRCADDRARLLRAAVEQARSLAAAGRADVDFVESDVYDAVAVLGAARSTSSSPGSARCAGCRTSRAGRRWSPTLLRPGGRLFIREGHPMLWALDERRDDGLLVVGSPTSSPSRWSSTRAGPTSRPTWCSSTHAPTSGTTASARS